MFVPVAPAAPPCQPPVATMLTKSQVAAPSVLANSAMARSARSPSLEGTQDGSAALCSA
jgi:hypothetical protein